MRVVLADDHAAFRLGLKEMLQTDEQIEIVGEAGDGREAVSLAKKERPDVVVLDVAMPHMGGEEATGLLLEELSPPPGVVILTMHDDPGLARALLGLGASAFLPKSASLGELLSAVRAAARGAPACQEETCPTSPSEAPKGQ